MATAPSRPGSQGSAGFLRPGRGGTPSFLAGVSLGAVPAKQSVQRASSFTQHTQDAGPVHASGAPRTTLYTATVMPPLSGAVPPKRLNTAPAAAFRAAAAGLRRQSSTGASEVTPGRSPRQTSASSTRSSSTNAPPWPSVRPPSSGQGAKADFHKGLVSALHQVLKKQRHGIFPQPAGLETDFQRGGSTLSHSTTLADSGAPLRCWGDDQSGDAEGQQQRTPPSAQPASDCAHDAYVEEVIKQRKVSWAQSRWRSTQQADTRRAEEKLGFRTSRDDPFAQSLDEPASHATQELLQREASARSTLQQNEAAKFEEIRIGAATGAARAPPRGPKGANGDMDAEALKVAGNAAYSTGDYIGAHKHYSRAIELSPNSHVLLTNRAATNMALLNYDAVVKDCLKAVALDGTFARGYARMAHAYLLLGQVRNAQKHYATASKLAASQSLPQMEQFSDEGSSVAAVEEATEAAKTEQHAAVVKLLSPPCAFAADPPLALLRLRSMIHTDPTRARADLMQLFGQLDHPASHVGDAVLLANSTLYYCDVLVALARASVCCGLHYLNISKTYLSQCLALKREHKGAVQLEQLVTQFDAKLREATTLLDQKRFQEAHAAYTAALAFDPSNKKLLSILYANRAEVSLKLANLTAVISDCTSALEADPANVKAMTIRAKCFADIGDFVRALRDMERAVVLNPALQDQLTALRRQQADDADSGEFFSRPGSSAFQGARAPPKPQSSGKSSEGEQRPRPASTSRDSRCHYTVLCLPQYSDIATVRQQYRKLTLRYHPDKCVNEPTAERQKSELRFKEISTAYSALCDAAAKEAYDATLRTSAEGRSWNFHAF